MAESRTNLSDRKIINTKGGAIRDPDFRAPEVLLVGRESGPANPLSGGSTPADPSNPPRTVEVGVPRDIQIEKQEVRVRSDGSAVVDMVLTYTTADGASRHEMRISKIA